jgi:glycosyltransferase involved in cell wall biosynthesis
MSRKNISRATGVRVLVSGCLPPPMGGMATFYESLLASSLPEQVNLAFVNTSSQTRTFEKGGRLSPSNLLQSFTDCWRFARAMQSHRPVIVHVGTAFGWSFVKHNVCVLIAWAFGSQVLLHPHCSYTALYKDRSRLWKWYFRRVISLAVAVIALSQEWLELTEIAPNCRVFALPNAVRLQPYREVAQERMNFPRLTRALHVLYLGHLGKAKGSFDLVEAAKSIVPKGERCEFKLIGGELSPGEETALHEKINATALEEQVHVCPPVTGSEKLAAYRWADVFVYPSYDEGMPMAVIEAMACGLPIIASKVGGLPDLVTEGVNGLLVEAGRPQQIASAISRLAEEPLMRASMGQQSYQRAISDYDFENRVTQLVGIYSTVLAQN